MNHGRKSNPTACKQSFKSMEDKLSEDIVKLYECNTGRTLDTDHFAPATD